LYRGRKKPYRETKMTKAVIRAIDLGYGHVKFTRRSDCENGPTVVTRTIPAIAVPVPPSRRAIDGGAFSQLQTMPVSVRGASYEVGPDTPLLLAGQSGRDLTGEYARSDRYEALMKGALSYMHESVIDVLVLGLPVSKFASEKDRLRETYERKTEVPDVTNPAQSKVVEIRKVLVVPQPFGGFLEAQRPGEGAEPRGSTLVVDPGFFTFDWIVVADGMRFVATRSGAVNGGVSSILRLIADHLEGETGATFTDMTPIEAAIKSGGPVLFGRKEVDLSRYAAAIEAKCEAYVADMRARLGGQNDIRHIVLCGGGAKLFMNAVAKGFADWDLSVANDAMCANVRGFQIFGENYARQVVRMAAQT
jgi:plasmid segregation protein ParM